ncbi:uncharacterized protein [Choristoneura fumiferana]|uniref:uncharacterized protein n=1 Tax=Choristoneura fumiferana TaxID=7141 RepID=UPI003D15BA66
MHGGDQSKRQRGTILQYADDLVLYTSSQSTDAAPSKLNEALSYLKIWLDDHGLTLSPSKSCIVTFTRSRSIPIMDIRYDDEVIPCLDAVKFLGVFLDSKMTGVPHLDCLRTSTDSDFKDQECIICTEKFNHPTRLPCGHVFCYLCVKGFPTCAFCRAEIKPEFLDHPVLIQQMSDDTKENEPDFQWYYRGERALLRGNQLMSFISITRRPLIRFLLQDYYKN